MVTEFFNKNNFANLKSDKSDVRPAWDQTRTIDDRLRIKRSFFKPILDLGSKILFSGKFFHHFKISIVFSISDNELVKYLFFFFIHRSEKNRYSYSFCSKCWIRYIMSKSFYNFFHWPNKCLRIRLQSQGISWKIPHWIQVLSL